MAEHEFTVTYDGPALESGRMPVRELAPALLALSDAFNAATRISEPNAQPPGLAISATSEGSFKVVLHVTDRSFAERVIDIFTSDPTTALVNGAGLVGMVIGGLNTVKWLKGRRIRSVDDLPVAGQARITFADGQTLDVPRLSIDLAQDIDFRKAAHDAVKPLEPGTVDEMTISDDQVSLRIDAHDVDAFNVPDVPDQELLDTNYETYLHLDTIAFGDNRKWKVSEGELTYWARITDLDFLNRVQRNEEAFSAGDLMHVVVRAQQWATTQGGMKVERTITRVIGHRPGPRQVPLPFEADANVNNNETEQD